MCCQAGAGPAAGGLVRQAAHAVASDSPDEMWETYEAVLRGLGIPHVHHLHIETREDACSPRAMRVLEDANAVFFTGGDQIKITSLVGDTPTFSRVFEILIDGGAIADTSAGASVMSETMMNGGPGSQSPRINEGPRLAPGFGFAKDMVIDQHFAERGRIGRLLGVVGQNPRILGVGIDENTAILMRSNRDFRVVGEGGVTVLDGKSVTYSNVAEDDSGDTMSVFGATLHVLGEGDVFDLKARRPKDMPARTGKGTSNGHAPAGNGRSRRNGAGRAGRNGTGKRHA